MNLNQVKLKGRYVIEKELGRGGLGIVYLAHDTDLLMRPVVIKTMLETPDRLDDSWFRNKFDKEIEALIRINHPGIVGVFDVGHMPDGKPFFVMQYVKGENMRGAIHPQGMELKRAAEIIRQLGNALSAAHEMGVTHRDLKPENIMLQTLSSGEEIVKLIDFGIATVKDLQINQLNQKTRVAGTIPYLAPEQLRGEPVPASDIWSLGVIAYELITGHLPFYADNLLLLAEQQRAGVGAMPKALRLELPVATQEVILKALSYDPPGRYPHAHQMGEEFLHSILGASEPPSPARAIPPSNLPPLTLEEAHILFIDLIGYSQLPMDEQVRRIRQLLTIVRHTPAFRQAEELNQLLRLPTGDGMALVFFQNPVAPVQCALEIAAQLKAHPDLQLRMGVHSGPVYRLLDINENMNVAGGGINLAQRVMDAGDAGHILLSRTAADILIQIGNWQQQLHDLGEHEVKHAVRVHFYNLYTGELGNQQWPTKLRQAQPAPLAAPAWPFRPISAALRRRCRELFELCDEFSSPDNLRAFFHTSELRPFAHCVGRSISLDMDKFIACLQTSGRQQPALLDLLEQLAARYEADYKGPLCANLKADIHSEIARLPESG
jgi:eukaryotic-like serine/threonine-protein kinase